jgi:hypothetical protein
VSDEFNSWKVSYWKYLWHVSTMRIKYRQRLKHVYGKGKMVIARLKDIYLCWAQNISFLPCVSLSRVERKFCSPFSLTHRPLPLFSSINPLQIFFPQGKALTYVSSRSWRRMQVEFWWVSFPLIFTPPSLSFPLHKSFMELHSLMVSFQTCSFMII